MKTIIKNFILTVVAAVSFQIGYAQDNWPKTIVSPDGVTIKIYPLQPQSFSGNVLKTLAAISVTKNSSEPVFGSFWATSTVETDREARQVTFRQVKVTALKIPADTNKADIAILKKTLESNFAATAGAIQLDDLLTSLSEETNTVKLSAGISTEAPKFIYSDVPAVLVTIDGSPIVQKNKKLGINEVVNSPFTIVQDEDNQFYLYGGNKWYIAPGATGPYSPVSTNIPGKLKRIEKKIASNKSAQPSAANEPNGATDSVIAKIIVSTIPAELIEIDGQAQFLPIEGTSLLYIGNSPNDIFMETLSKQYYMLIAGRWYHSQTLTPESQWLYIGSDQLPADFTKIPEGSPKDNVLASIAGTKAAREAVMDAQIPQTAKVDRKKAVTQVTYDGLPQFQAIEGTNLQYAVNTASTVLYDNKAYYAVDNGIWFISPGATGPWSVSTRRPANLDQIPPSSPVYNVKFVDIYDITPDYIYMGYTPGYLNSYIYGSTLVYGTGFYYRPWRGHFYYARPWSWGFGMSYNPWFGWGFGLGYGFDWFDYAYGPAFGGWYSGWWGPSFYLPTCWGYSRGFRPNHFYGSGLVFRGGTHIHSGGNIYKGRTGISFRNNAGEPNRFSANNGKPNLQEGRTFNKSNSVFSDKQGNTFQRNDNGKWQANSQRNEERNQGDLRPVDNLDKQQAFRDAGQMRSQNFQRAQSFSSHMGGFGSGAFGGGLRGSFGGGGGFRGGFGGGGSRSGGRH
jgi:hypothetical protein